MTITVHGLSVTFTPNPATGQNVVESIKDQRGREVDGGSDLLDLIEPHLIEAAPFAELEEAWANCEHAHLFRIF